jgi:hypothetical protein
MSFQTSGNLTWPADLEGFGVKLEAIMREGANQIEELERTLSHTHRDG